MPWLERRGYAVIRFTARQVEHELPAVIETIRELCGSRTM
jgi:very-short-patch-repair endonuclease